jgi:hypothetical protein
MTAANRIPAAVFATAISLLSASTASAQLISETLDPSQLPSSQGWGYYSLNSVLASESQVFSTSGGILTSNTLGNGFQGQGGNFVYTSASPGSFTSGQDWIVESRVRVLEGERISFGYGFCIGAAFDGMTASVGIMNNLWQDSSLFVASRDNTEWATWRIETKRDLGLFRLYVNDVLISSPAIAFGASGGDFPEHYAFLGDGTGGANARAEVASFSFRQVPVPAPGAAAVLGLGGLMAARRRR